MRKIRPYVHNTDTTVLSADAVLVHNGSYLKNKPLCQLPKRKMQKQDDWFENETDNTKLKRSRPRSYSAQSRYRLGRRAEKREAERARGEALGEARPRGEAFEAERVARRPLATSMVGGCDASS
jgi:hypothetical protein